MWAAGDSSAPSPHMLYRVIAAGAFFVLFAAGVFFIGHVAAGAFFFLVAQPMVDGCQADPAFLRRLVFWTQLWVCRRRDLFLHGRLISTGTPAEVTRFHCSNGKHGEGTGVHDEVGKDEVSMR